MKMWEQTFISLNATLFFQKHHLQMAELGFTANDADSRKEYFAEVLTSSEVQIPMNLAMPEKPEDWTSFELPSELLAKSETHEDKVMAGRWTFVKPELTYFYLKKVLDVLEG